MFMIMMELGHNPREWFIAPLNIIESAAEMIIKGNIVDYVYDINSQTIVPK